MKEYLVENLRDPVWYTEKVHQRGLTEFPPAIITCAITGSNNGKESNPNLPETIDEQVESAYEAYQAGAAMIHIHTRDPQDLSRMSWDPERYREVNRRIREKCPDVIINNTNVCGRHITTADGIVTPTKTSITEAGAEVGSIDVSCYFSSIPMKPRLPDHPDPWVLDRGYCISDTDVMAGLKKMEEYGVKPEFECFAMSDLQYVRRLINKGWTDWTGGPNWIDFVYTTGSNWPFPLYMSTLVQAVPKNSMLGIIATGAQQWPVLTQALCHGLNVRVGMEDSVRLANGKKADSNAQLVENIINIAKSIGRPVATCAQAREMLGLGAPKTWE